jgi:DNA-directed RNA polymerases I, II, and III subunit RPABC2
MKKHLETEQISDDLDINAELQIDQTIKKSNRPEDEVVTYNEVEFELKEITSENRVLIGPPRLTRFERARISGARSLQLSLGAPSLIRVSNDIRDSITLAVAELDLKALPISIRRILPNGLYQDISIDLLK